MDKERTLESTNPATGEVMKTIPMDNITTLTAKYQRCRAYHQRWRDHTTFEVREFGRLGEGEGCGCEGNKKSSQKLNTERKEGRRGKKENKMLSSFSIITYPFIPPYSSLMFF